MKKFLDKDQLHILEGYGVDIGLNENWGVEEILEMLPPTVKEEGVGDGYEYVMVRNHSAQNGITYSTYLRRKCLNYFFSNNESVHNAETPVDAWYKMWVWTLEHVEE